MQYQPQMYGTNRNITIVLKDITGPVLKKDGKYSGTTVIGGEHTCILVSVDGVVPISEDSIGTTSDFETLLQQTPTSMPRNLINIGLKPAAIQATLLASFASKTKLLVN
jgi:hypothetical protein